jgi:hypothetical protein
MPKKAVGAMPRRGDGDGNVTSQALMAVVEMCVVRLEAETAATA